MSILDSLSERKIAGISVGVGSMLLILTGQHALGTTLLAGLLGFFVGEKNGERKSPT